MLLSSAALACNRVPNETPHDFALVFTSTSADGYLLNTFRGTLQKSKKPDGNTAIPFRLTKPQLDSVYILMRAIDFFSLPEYLEPEMGVKAFPAPWFSYTVRANGVLKHVSFGGSFTAGVSALYSLRRLNRLLAGMILNSPEYRQLVHSTTTMRNDVRDSWF